MSIKKPTIGTSIKANVCLTDDHTTTNYLKSIWNNNIGKNESLYMVCLNNWLQVLSFHWLNTGDEHNCSLNLNETISLALRDNATKIIIAHNHPSGNLKPSANDIKLTKNLHLRCKCVGIELLDHLILTPGYGTFSFLNDGILDKFESEHSGVLNATDPDKFECKVLQLANLYCKERLKGVGIDYLKATIDNGMERLFIKYFDPINLSVTGFADFKKY